MLEPLHLVELFLRWFRSTTPHILITMWLFLIEYVGVVRWKTGKTKKSPQMRADELEERLIDFAVRVINLSANLPKTPGRETC